MVRLLSALCFLAASVCALDFKLYGLNYNARQGADWDPKRCKSQDQVDTDMVRVAAVSPRVRIYSLSDCNQGELVLNSAKKAGLKVWLGMWVTKDPASLQAEQNALQQLITKGLIDSNVIGLHVGSENLYRKDLTPDQAIAYFKQVKTFLQTNNIKLNVTIADIVDSFVQYPQVLDVVDVIQANEFPFWEPAAIDTAMVNFRLKLDNLTAIAKGKEIQISETGWASGGRNANASVASPENQAKYLVDLVNFANTHNLKYYYFAAFDDSWKTVQEKDPNTVEATFGIYDSQGIMKAQFSSLSLTPSAVDPDKTNVTSAPPVIQNTSTTGTTSAPSTTSATGASVVSTVGAAVVGFATIASLHL
ncbi:unnamed protein product [Aphanomyces euteiches]|uniref:glucan endo-1,3-beta-D-glucosidase n=1 Tax=Aphanomyces euteiches TaxID=100861 RepID=A0A6G0XBB2_9STRA|nr:hypothetical protein Ae201684_006611 [Aphanomyces euteiches]KAH9091210.1 hypothetical protein Ae201684P_006610 [Aphanomyces euteiches]KAH9136405.1 hypothetical protein AeRB84_018417 [Aphanomyces euteiches]